MSMKMHIETKSTHISAANSNLFKELGFAPSDAKKLHDESQHIISEKLRLKEYLMSEISQWIADNTLKQIEAAAILGITRPRVSDVVNKKLPKFTIDALVDMVAKTGRDVQLSVQKRSHA